MTETLHHELKLKLFENGRAEFNNGFCQTCLTHVLTDLFKAPQGKMLMEAANQALLIAAVELDEEAKSKLLEKGTNDPN